MVDKLRFVAVHDGAGILFIEILRAVKDAVEVGLALEIIRDERAAIHVVTFRRDDGDLSRCIDASDTLDTSDSRCSVSDDHVVFLLFSHTFHLSS